MISLIVAYAHNNVIGKGGIIPWDLPDDREHFKKLTFGSVVIMGRRTFEEIYKKFGKGLLGRETIILSKTQNYSGENYRTVISLNQALEIAKSMFPQKDIFICGGESVYREAVECRLAQKMYITEIDADFDGDAFFPVIDKSDYKIEEKCLIETPIQHVFITLSAQGRCGGGV